jgi:hypothetical protein
VVIPSGSKTRMFLTFFFYLHPEICCSKAKATVGAQQWKNAEDSLFSLGKGNVESVDSIVR